MPRVTKTQLEGTINKLKEEKKQLEDSIIEKEEQFKNEKIKLKGEHTDLLVQKESEFTDAKSQMKGNIQELENQNKDKQNQLNKRELKKLAEAYKKQEEDYGADKEKWFKYILFSLLVLIASVLFSNYLSADALWYEKFEHYIINFIAVTFLVFSLKQYSYYNKLRTDYANRKTLAQSYHNILSSEEDAGIRADFLDKATDVLCAKIEIIDEAHTIPEKLLESITEIAKNLSKKA